MARNLLQDYLTSAVHSALQGGMEGSTGAIIDKMTALGDPLRGLRSEIKEQIANCIAQGLTAMRSGNHSAETAEELAISLLTEVRTILAKNQSREVL